MSSCEAQSTDIEEKRQQYLCYIRYCENKVYLQYLLISHALLKAFLSAVHGIQYRRKKIEDTSYFNSVLEKACVSVDI